MYVYMYVSRGGKRYWYKVTGRGVLERGGSGGVLWRSQPNNLVPLCKFQVIIIIHFFRNSLFSQSMNMKIFA